MATTIDTNPATTLTINDANNADTITVSDGPAENGFQTTQVTTATDTTIFANKTAVTIDGGNKGENVVFDNPDPAAGLKSLTVQNLGGAGSTINGSNPNASSPDIAVAAETLFAGGGIGTNRALRTQASTLSARAGLSGGANINIANGVAAPVTLNITLPEMDSAFGGTITLSNNGTINDTGSGILAVGAVNITATGATADLNTGSGAGISSTPSSVTLTVGRDINLGDGVGVGSIAAATGITAMAGRDITLNANATVTNGTSGNVSLTAGGNFTMLTSPGNAAVSPRIASIAAGGTVALSAGSGHALTLDSTGTTAVQSFNGAIFLSADAMLINKGVNAGTAAVTLAPATAGQAIRLGGANAPGVLGLSQAELNQLTAAVVRVGGASADNITIASAVNGLAHSNTLSLIDNGSISQTALGSLATANLRVSSTGPVTLDNAGNNIGTVSASVTGPLTIVDGTNTLTVPTLGLMVS
jgi:hypothetical protein